MLETVLKLLIDALMKLGGMMPLRAVHAAGAWLGCVAYALGPRYRRRMRENMRIAGVDESLLPEIKRHAGMQALEPFWVWTHSNAEVDALCEVDGATVKMIRDALEAGRNIVFMTPHVGCYEVTPVVAYERALKAAGKQMSVLYRAPRKAFLQPLVAIARLRPGMDPQPADLRGVRNILKALRSGGILGCLPDQVPGRGEGAWAPFFGRDAFTMTFPLKCARQFDAVRFIAISRRVPGKGWKVSITAWDDPLTGDLAADAALMNKALERVIMQAPEQYIWNYNRYKRPRGVHAAPSAAAQQRSQA
ncbi:MAG: lysophospholipid acyltransferase family protein [Duodenibacillus sp.]|nr:lysophospholipid acyltransferase family protein [Duodenibacillus sp.]